MSHFYGLTICITKKGFPVWDGLGILHVLWRTRLLFELYWRDGIPQSSATVDNMLGMLRPLVYKSIFCHYPWLSNLPGNMALFLRAGCMSRFQYVQVSILSLQLHTSRSPPPRLSYQICPVILRVVERLPFSRTALNHGIFTEYEYLSVMPVFLQSLSRPLNQDHSNSIGTSSKGTCFAPMGFMVYQPFHTTCE